MRLTENGLIEIIGPGSIFYRVAYSMKCIGYEYYGIWTPPGSKFYGAGPYSIIEVWPAGSIFYRV